MVDSIAGLVRCYVYDRRRTMTEKSDYFAEPPSPEEWRASSAAEDALSEILHIVQLQGQSVARYACRAPFNIALPAGTRRFHIVEQGPIRIQAPGMPATQSLNAGDLALCARGDGHHLQAGTANSPLIF